MFPDKLLWATRPPVQHSGAGILSRWPLLIWTVVGHRPNRNLHQANYNLKQYCLFFVIKFSVKVVFDLRVGPMKRHLHLKPEEWQHHKPQLQQPLARHLAPEPYTSLTEILLFCPPCWLVTVCCQCWASYLTPSNHVTHKLLDNLLGWLQN